MVVTNIDETFIKVYQLRIDNATVVSAGGELFNGMVIKDYNIRHVSDMNSNVSCNISLSY